MKKQAQQISLASFFKRGGTVDPPQPGKTATSSQSSSNALANQNPAVRKTARQLPGTVLIQNLNQSRKGGDSNGGGYNRMGFRARNDAEERPDIDLSKQYKLSTSQKRVLDAIVRRKSVFFTGAAGTGKSYVVQILRSVIEALQWEDKIAYTAPTGVAACNIRGLTIHSWAGVGKASEPIEQLLPIVLRNSNACKRWRETEILVIDEISMLSAELFDKLDVIGRRVRNNINPFGGLQIIVCGDFFQLPPVGLGKTVKFCFEAQAWKSLFEDGRDDGMIILDKVFRQKDDTTFLNLLNEMREGQISMQNQQLLQRKVEDAQRWMQQEQMEARGDGFFQSASTVANNREKKLTVRPTKLFSTNHDVDQYNMTELERLQKGGGGGADDEDKEPVIYFAVDQGKDPYLTQIKSGTKAPEKLYLKKGAQVMLLKNLDTERGLVNGARGTVVDFERSNGRTSFHSLLPVVNFTIIMGSTRSEERVVLTPETWEVKLGETVLASRQQIPLMLAWAISIHKSQGMTIPLLEVSFNRMFEFGQAYVALSRATSLQGLTLHSFQAQSIRAHPLVKDFYRDIATANQRQQPHHHQQHQQYAMASLPPTTDDVLEVCLGDFVNAFQVDFDPKAVDYDQWIDSRGRSTTTTVETTQRQRVEERRYEDTSNRSQFVPPPSLPLPSTSLHAQPERSMVHPHRPDNGPSQPSASSAMATAAANIRKPSGLLNSSFSAASLAPRPMMNPVRNEASSGFQDAGRSNAHGDDWLDQDFMAKKRAEAAQRLAVMEQQYLHSSTAAAMSASFVPPPPTASAIAAAVGSSGPMRRESPPTTVTLMPTPTTLPVAPSLAPSSAPSSSSKNKETAVEIVDLLDSAGEDSIPYVPPAPTTGSVMACRGEPPAVNDFGGYGYQPHLTCNESPLNRVLQASTSSSNVLGVSSSTHAPAGASSSFSSSSESVTVGNGVVLTDSLKRKLEENRQRALEKLEKFKKSRLEQSSSHI